MKRLDFIIRYNQLLVHVCTAFLYKRLFHITSAVDENIYSLKRARFLIVVNHTRKRDPFDILSVLPFSIMLKLAPIRFFTANRFFLQWWKRVIVSSLGCFRAYKTDEFVSGVKGGLTLADRGQTLCIFPQGRIVKTQDNVSELKTGLSYLVTHRDFVILPVYIKPTNKKRHIVWGKPFTLSEIERKKEHTELTRFIFQKVISLEKHI